MPQVNVTVDGNEYEDIQLIKVNSKNLALAATGADIPSGTDGQYLGYSSNSPASISPDTAPTQNSGKLVTSGGVYTALQNVSVPVDNTLSNAGQAADAKAAGDAIDDIEDTLGDICDPVLGKNLYNKDEVLDSDLVGKIVSTTGSISPVAAWTYNVTTNPIPVEPNTYYCISGWNNTSGRNARCLKADGTSKLKVLAPSNGEEYESSYAFPNADASDTLGGSARSAQFLTPPTAAYVQFNVATKDTDARSTIMLEKVGTTYNPNFVPSTYEPYGLTGTQLKTSALPESWQNAGPDAAAAVRRKFKLKVLFVGSSHLMNTTCQFPFIGYKSGIDVEVGSVYVGALSLQNAAGMAMNGVKVTLKYFADGTWASTGTKTFAEVYGYTDWDYIIIQRSAGDDQKWLTTQAQADADASQEANINKNVPEADPVYRSHDWALQYVLDLIRSNATNRPTVLFSTGFADANEGSGDTQTTNNNTTAATMQARFGLQIIPVATTLRNARNTYLRLIGKNSTYHNLCYDSQHLDYGIGCYVPGMAVWAFILRQLGWDVSNLNGYGTVAEVSTFTSIAGETGNYTEPTPETMSVAKACAMCACNDWDTPSAGLADRYKWAVTQTLGSATSTYTKGYCGNHDTLVAVLSGETEIAVTMGGVDVTATAYDSTTHKVTIDSVTGDVVITNT